jgi:lipopolysaccharide biosynthesis glycosyltransferase
MATDAAYALPLAVTLRSALANLEPAQELVAYVIDAGLPPEARELIIGSTDRRCTLHWIPAAGAAFEGLPSWGRMSATTYNRLLLGKLLPAAVERVLWLDCDLLILGNLAELWSMPLNGATTGAVRDPFIPCLGSRFGLRGVDTRGRARRCPYFNAGVMLIDLVRWRSVDVAGQAIDFLRRYRDRVFYQDQAALNAVLTTRWTELGQRWNWMPNGPRQTGDGLRAAGIVHFSGSLKPWRMRGSSPLHRRYMEYVDLTAWSGFRPPRSMTGTLLALYDGSTVRRWVRPLEQRAFEAYMIATRRYEGG